MKTAEKVAVVILCILSVGCVLKHNRSYSTAKIYYRTMMSSVLSNPAWYNQYYSELDPQKKVELRNRLIGYCIWLADDDFNTYAARFSHNQAVASLLTDWSSLAMSGASTIASPPALFGAISTGIQGAHAAYDHDALSQQTRGAIILKMEALRQEKLIEIYRSEQLPDSQYTLVQGLIDVQQYVNAGTVYAALAAISQDASLQRQNNTVILKTLRQAK